MKDTPQGLNSCANPATAASTSSGVGISAQPQPVCPMLQCSEQAVLLVVAPWQVVALVHSLHIQSRPPWQQPQIRLV
jgi:hypothetical protein